MQMGTYVTAVCRGFPIDVQASLLQATPKDSISTSELGMSFLGGTSNFAWVFLLVPFVGPFPNQSGTEPQPKDEPQGQLPSTFGLGHLGEQLHNRCGRDVVTSGRHKVPTAKCKRPPGRVRKRAEAAR